MWGNIVGDTDHFCRCFPLKSGHEFWKRKNDCALPGWLMATTQKRPQVPYGRVRDHLASPITIATRITDRQGGRS